MNIRLHKALAARRILKRDPWHSEDERLAAADFADRVLFTVCVAVGLWLVADWASVDLAAWFSAQPPVNVR